MFSIIEDTAETMFFAKVEPKAAVVVEPKVPTEKPNLVAKKPKKKRAPPKKKKQKPNTNKNKINAKSNNNRKENDPKPYLKKRGKPRGKKSVNKKKENSVPILPITDLKLGSKIEGRVAAFTDFGVFLQINYKLKNKGGRGGYALLHKSQIRDEVVDDPKKLFRIGAVVKDLRVLKINYARGEVSLSLRKQREERKSLSEFSVGQEYEGKVAKVVNYGAFIELGAKANALLHISRISQKKIKNIRNWLNEGDSVRVRLIDVNEEANTMAASMLGMEADRYLDQRNAQLKRMKEKTELKNAEAEKSELKSELEYFEDAVKELENALD